MVERNIYARLGLKLQDWAKGWQNAAKQGQDALRRMQGATQGFGDAASSHSKRAGNAFTRFVGGIKSGVTGMIGSLAKLTIAFAGAQMAVVALQSAFREFIGGLIGLETTLTRIVSLTAVTDEELASIRKNISAIAVETGVSANRVAEAFYFSASAIDSTEKALAVTTISAKAAAAGLGEAETIARLLTSAMNAYNLSADEAEGVMDTLMATVKYGSAEPAELAENLGKLLPVAAQLNISLPELGANLATLSLGGMDAAEGTTALRSLMMQLIKPSKQAQDALDALGLSAAGLRRQIREEGLAAALFTLMEATGGNEEVLATIIPNVRGLVGILGTAGTQAKTYARILEDVKGEGGLFAEAWERYTRTFEYQLNRFKEIVRDSIYDFGERVLPYVTSALEAFTNFIRSGFDLSVLRTELLQRFGIDIQGIIPLLSAFRTGLITVWEAGTKVVQFLREHKTAAIAAAVAFGVLFAWMHPLMAAILGVILVIGWFREHWDLVKTKVMEFVNTCKAYIEWFREIIHKNFGWAEEFIKGIWQNIYYRIKFWIDLIRDTIKVVMAIIKGDWKGAWNALKDLAVNAFNNMKEAVLGTFRALKGALGGVWQGIQQVFARAINWIIEKILNPFLSKVGMVSGWARKIPGAGKFIPDVGEITWRAPTGGLEVGEAPGWQGTAGLSEADQQEIARFRRRADALAKERARADEKRQAELAAEIERLLRMADEYEEGLEDAGASMVEGAEDGAESTKKAAKSAAKTADSLDTAATTIGKAVEKFVDPIERAFRQFYWAWRRSGLVWENFIRKTFAEGVPKVGARLQAGVQRFAGGAALLGERGRELAVLPSGTRVYSAPETAQLLGGRSAARSIVNQNEFHLNVTGDKWEEIRRRVIEMLDDAAAEAGIRSPHTVGGVGIPRL